MSRSKWKGPFIHIKKENNKKKYINHILVSRNTNITPNFEGFICLVYNGKTFSELTVTKDMIGHKFGEFSLTRVNFIFKKKKN